ncbi:MAG: YfiR family protein [Nitrospirae bacterium]|nr:YfiR family protein [Nitrospirota bacterium]
MKRCLICFIVLVATQLSAPLHTPASAAADSGIEELTLKAVYIEKITRFVEWPRESAIDDTSKPFVIGIIGDNAFEPVLKKIFSSIKIRDKKVTVRRISDIDGIAGCHLLFISNISKEKLQKVLASTMGRPILTVGDTEGFAAGGVLVNFYVSNNKLRFEINETAVRESVLSFSYMLMQIAKIVNPAGGR